MEVLQIVALVGAIIFVVASVLNFVSLWYGEHGQGRCTGMWKVPSLLGAPWVRALLMSIMGGSLLCVWLASIALNS